MDKYRWELIKKTWRDYMGLSLKNQTWLMLEFKTLVERDEQVRGIIENWDIGKLRDHEVVDQLYNIYLEDK